MDNFQQWAEVTKLSGLQRDAQQQGILDGYIAEINTSLTALNTLSLKWGQAVTKAQLAHSDITEAITELDNLSDRVEQYSDSSQR